MIVLISFKLYDCNPFFHSEKSTTGEIGWDHDLDEWLVGTTEIEQIDANVIREKWMNPVFVDFVFWYSIRVSNNRKYIILKLLQDPVYHVTRQQGIC